MLSPRNITLKRNAFEGEMVLVKIADVYAYENGKKTEEVTGVRCTCYLPAYDYEKLSVKLPAGAAVDPNLVGKSVEFPGFQGKVYCIDGKMGFSINADAIVAAK